MNVRSLLTTAFALASCSCLFPKVVGPYDSALDGQGGAGLVVELPFAQGVEKMCTQGVGGTHSHTGTSTYYDLDMDTSNDIDEEIFVPVSGTVYVHTESAASNFGYHVNIDLGDGTYVVLAHLSDIFLQDGEEVAVGQLLGYEGCTGDCDGDHVHIGLHEGDPSKKAEYGTSVPTTYRAANQSQDGELTTIDSGEFSCGIRSRGDDKDGDTYESDLSINLWHPDGTLVKTPDNARVYVLEDGSVRWIENESTFWGLGYDFADVALMSEEELECYAEGEDIVGETFIDAAFDVEEELWLIVGDGDDSERYRIAVRGTGWEDVLASWGLNYGQDNWPDTYGDTSDYMVNWPPASGYAGLRDGTLVKEEDASDVYFISHGFALPIETWDVYLLMNFYSRDILTVEDEIVSALHEVGNCAVDEMCLDMDAVTMCGGGLELDDSSSMGGSSDSDEEEEDENEDEDAEEDDTQETAQEENQEEAQDEDVEEEEQGESSDEEEGEDDDNDENTLSIEIDYPANYPELTLTVQPIFAVSSLGDSWSASESVWEDDKVSWSEQDDYSGLLGVRFNVNVDTDGDGEEDDWYCYGHYSTAFLEYGVAVEIVLNADEWDENDLLTWSPGDEDEVDLGCSALLWLGSTSSITVGYVQ